MFALERAAFGHDFACWQAVGILLHLVVLGLFLLLALRLLRLRRALGPPGPAGLLPWVALGLAGFFAVNLCALEMVIWSHINPYMVLVITSLGVMLLVLDLLATPTAETGRRPARVAAIWLLLAIGAFTHEIGQFFAVVVGAVLALDALGRGQGKKALARFLVCASVLAVYQATDRLDRWAHPNLTVDLDYHDIAAQALRAETFTSVARYLLFTVVQPFVPEGLVWHPRPHQWSIYSRLAFTEPWQAWPNRLYPRPLLAASIGAGLVILLRTVGPLGRSGRGGPRRTMVLFLLMPAGLAGLHLAITVLGRINVRHDGLTYSTYYAYLPLLMVLLGLFALWTTEPVTRRTVALDATLLACLVPLTWAGATQCHRINVVVQERMGPQRHLK